MGGQIHDDDHLAAGFVGLHRAVRLTDLLEAEYARRRGVQPAGLHLVGIFWSGTSDSGKPGVPNTKLAKKVR
jgi:hypothetical protein